MRRFIALVAAVAAVAAVSVAPPAPAADCTRILDREVPAPGLAVPDRHIRVLVPPDYCHAGNTTAYPVLYLLHGTGDTWQDWTTEATKGKAVTISAGREVIIVMPDGGRGHQPGHAGDAGWYSDWVSAPTTLPPDPTCPAAPPDWETFHTDVLVDYVDTEFRTLGDGHRAVAGLSMGGFGALKYAALARDGNSAPLFTAAASFSGALDLLHGAPVSGVAFEQMHSTPFGQFGTPNDCVWGDQTLSRSTWEDNNPADLALEGKLNGVTLFLATGTGTPGGFAGDDPANPGGYALEQGVWQLNAGFVAKLGAGGGSYNPNGGMNADLPHAADWFYPGGLHSWPYWNAALAWALPQIVGVID